MLIEGVIETSQSDWVPYDSYSYMLEKGLVAIAIYTCVLTIPETKCSD